ncbi:MAG TPA: VOC family protein [Mycetocola sp.]|jgi:catechol 2,3-dioxygenase-like lactoylglutathione lyase family enzyme|uniref:VOC family protein n=1 Tax=Mycetocola sp. TaxID=1871042 RepID=UPI002627C79C|nr:VOC family protein [Mycetocola sp.]MCU1560633.1 glyoxalase [Mycetocola sp.]HEV7848397.1 VOC family protein [Mycetocola sp.]
MFTPVRAFSGFSVDDIDAARSFYSEKLGLTVTDDEMGFIRIILPGGADVLAYPKPDHSPASFTILNFVVSDVDTAVHDLNGKGIQTKIYDDPDLPTDDRGIMRDNGPMIAWFRDPAGNVLSVIAE